MASEIGVLVVHGIGVQQENFADAFIAEMTSRLERLSVDRGVVEWRSGFWADLLTPHEVKLWDDLSLSSDMDWVTVRKFVINVLADAVAYRRQPGAGHDMYGDIHNRILDHLAQLRARDAVVRTRTLLVNHVRGALKTWGERLPAVTARTFAWKVAPTVPAALTSALAPVLAVVEHLTAAIAAFDQQLHQLATAYPSTERLRQVSPAGLDVQTIPCQRQRFP